MVDANINSTNTDIVFQECFPRHKRSNGRQKMLYPQFLLALTVIAQRKYGQADPVGGLLQLVHEHLLPTAYEVQLSFRSASVAMAPPPCDVETSRLFDEMNDTLKAIFEHYTRVRAVQKGGQAGMLVKELHKVAEDLGIVPKMLSYSEVLLTVALHLLLTVALHLLLTVTLHLLLTVTLHLLLLYLALCCCCTQRYAAAHCRTVL